jgi:phosphatidylglycerophosphate synthase
VTLLRCVGGVFLLALGLATLGGTLTMLAALRWMVVALAVTMLALDGVDGHLARRFGQASSFGARFDMETDALLMLALSLLVWAAGLVGAWVLLSGLMRYIFILGGWVWPVLAQALPPRWRRQAVCVAQMSVLILALAPPLAAWAPTLCLVGLVLLSYSFGSDWAWLLVRAKAESEAVVERA